MSDYEMEVTVPVVLTVTFDKHFAVEKEQPLRGISLEEIEAVQTRGEFTDKAKREVTKKIRNGEVSSIGLYPPTSVTVEAKQP